MIDASALQEAAATKAALETLLYSVEDRLAEIVARATSHTDAQLGAIYEKIIPPVSGALASADINLPGEDGGVPLDWSAVSSALSTVDASISPHEETVNAITQRAVDSVSAHIDALLPNTTDILGALAGALSQLVGGLLGSLAEVPELWAGIYPTLKEQFGTDYDPITRATGEFISDASAIIGDVLAKSLNGYALLGKSVMTGNDTKPLNPEDLADRMNAWPEWLRSIVDVGLEFVSAWSVLSALAAPKVSESAQAANALNPIAPLSSAELVALLRRGKIGDEFAYREAARVGTGRNLLDLKFQLTERLLDTTPIIEYWRRTGDDAILDELPKLGYRDEDIAILKELSLAVPTASDVVRFLARDVSDAKAIQEGGLDVDFEQKYDEKLFNQAGVTKGTALLYWMSHWSLPSPTMGYEMLHRGLITHDQLTDLLKLADYAPGWVDRLAAISYAVPGRIDVRRMWEAGVITDRAELVARYQHMGYSPEDADTLATFTERIGAKSREAEAERTRAPIVHAVVQQYASRATDYQHANDMLVNLGLSPDRAAFLLQQGDFERAQDREKRIALAIGRDYVKGFLGRDEAFSRLSDYGFGDTEIGQLFESWDLDRELAEWTAEQRHERDLNKSEVLRAYHERLTTTAEASAQLAQLGYDSAELATLIRLEDAKISDAENRLAEQAIHTQYINRRLEAAGAISGLQGLGYQSQRVAYLLARWNVEREEKTPRVTAAQLQHMLVQGIVPKDVVEQRLIDFGYPPEDINMLLTMWGTDMSIAADKLEEQKREFSIREARLSDQGAARIGLTSRSLDIKETQFSQLQDALQNRFESSQKATRDLQQQRLDASSLLQSQRIASQTARDAANVEAARQRQAKTIEDANARLDRTIASHEKTAAAAAAERDKALAQQRDLAAQAQAATTARAAAVARAAADRQQVAIDAANARQASSQAAAAALNDQRAANNTDLTVLRGHIQEARDIRLRAIALEKSSVAEQQRIRSETRASARKTIEASGAAANAADLQALVLQQNSEVAAVNSRFAALQAAVTTQRAQTLLAQRMQAEALLSAATPASTLLDVGGL